ncbi:tripartite tricarboxylate transporter TctB family protein [Kushneria indalinina]|uniref:Tripartite tricarboxylate transporter TctB family protein n=1 Tax=Kushneria indalinina DSM 14324 TaxID=1122140 RepID=A0A3D9E0A5_9GAMM|nr:tripartite tricarboxylate transporter TctB family protein [Kushneria indalinina]REC96458.1 tripartite tricarboxylate transporter TctB family protein [Kushneria indalinina DSM 14324]
MVKTRSDALFHLVLLALAGWFLQQAWHLPANAAGGSLSPAFFPRAISSAIVLLLLISMVRGLIAGTLLTRDATNEEATAPAWVPVVAWGAVALLLVFYAMLLEPLGYVISTALFLFLCVAIVSVLSRQRGESIAIGRVLMLALFAATVSVAIFLIFSVGFEIVLPTIGVMGV